MQIKKKPNIEKNNKYLEYAMMIDLPQFHWVVRYKAQFPALNEVFSWDFNITSKYLGISEYKRLIMDGVALDFYSAWRLI